MHVGVNYPWLDYGWDFGNAPPGWRQTHHPRWAEVIDDDLARFSSLGIRVVRLFVLGDGLTYGTGPSAPRPDRSHRGGWRFDPPRISQTTLDHFAALLDRFAAAATRADAPIQILPVLIDFHFCLKGHLPVTRRTTATPTFDTTDPGWVKGGRGDAIADPARQLEFLAGALDPLLEVARARADLIYAWELINEPEWVTEGWHPSRLAGPLPVPAASMQAFLTEGMSRVRAAGLKPTVGFATFRTIERTGVTAEINQFHHYAGGRRRLPEHTFHPEFPGIIGEFATAETDVWPELDIERQGLLHRLRLARALGYPMAMPWAYRSQDRHTAWTPDVERDIRTFTRELP